MGALVSDVQAQGWSDVMIDAAILRPIVWTVIAWLASMLLLVGSVAVMLSAPPNKWDRAVAIGICGGLPLLRLEDGSVWLRVNGVRIYRVENPDKLTCG
jgi:hypothetical protein